MACRGPPSRGATAWAACGANRGEVRLRPQRRAQPQWLMDPGRGLKTRIPAGVETRIPAGVETRIPAGVEARIGPQQARASVPRATSPRPTSLKRCWPCFPSCTTGTLQGSRLVRATLSMTCFLAQGRRPKNRAVFEVKVLDTNS
jgi:hypothetical protein